MGDIDCLKACSGCSRHVRCGERVCPFCGAAVTVFMRAPEYRLKTRLGRGATFSLGAALGAIGFVLGCSDDAPQPVYGAACNPPSCPFTYAGTGGSAAAGASAGSTNAGSTNAGGNNVGGNNAGGNNAGGSAQGGGTGALSEGGAAGAEGPSEGGAAGQ